MSSSQYSTIFPGGAFFRCNITGIFDKSIRHSQHPQLFAADFAAVGVPHPPLVHVLVHLARLAGVVESPAELAVALRPVLGPAPHLVEVSPPEVGRVRRVVAVLWKTRNSQ